MANHAHSTRTPILTPTGAPPPLLGRGSGRQPGPVTIALAAMRAADPDRRHVRELRRRIAERINADIALLDVLDGDPESEPSLGSIDATSHTDFVDQEGWAAGLGFDCEAGDDNGIADGDGLEWATQPTRRAA